jgi:DNA modification methylase
MNKFILGDNLEILKTFNDESIDLIYLDPPFFSNRNYEVIWGDEGEIRSFADRWSGGMDHYIGWLKERITEMHRILKPTGSIFLHCDWHADAYIRVEILDKIFGATNFRNKITWKRSDSHNDAKRQFPNLCDDIFFYSKSNNLTFNAQYTAHNPQTLKEWYLYLEFSDGTIRRMSKEELETQEIPLGSRRFNTADMSAPAGGGMSQIMNDTGKPRGWYEYNGYSPPEKGWRYSIETMERLDILLSLHHPIKEKMANNLRISNTRLLIELVRWEQLGIHS